MLAVAAPLEGDVIVAEVNGSIWSARSLADGRQRER